MHAGWIGPIDGEDTGYLFFAVMINTIVKVRSVKVNCACGYQRALRYVQYVQKTKPTTF